MCKVYSFRLNDNNPRESQAREVIEAWIGEGYSLRHVIVEALQILEVRNEQKDSLEVILEEIRAIGCKFSK